jgi:hypothetical protein
MVNRPWGKGLSRQENMAVKVSTKEAGSQLGLEQKEVIRRIRRGDIEAEKFGWVWTIDQDEIERVKEKDWYKRYQNRHSLV